MTTGNVTRSRTQGRTESQVIPIVNGLRVSTVSPRSGLVSSIFAGQCPACSTYRRHQSDGLRRCGCGQLYRIIVGSVVGVPIEATH